MPLRPATHQIADRAVSAIMALCAKSGWAVEQVQHDYGEDLLVQTQFRDVVDPCRLWMQVKGTSNIECYRRKGGDFRYSISLAHALRWARHIEPVIFVLWDVHTDSGHWTTAQEAFNVVDLTFCETNNVQINISSSSKLDSDSLEQIEWHNRISHFNTLITLHMGHEERTRQDYEEGLISEIEPAIRHASLAAYGFMRHVGIVNQKDDLDVSVIRYFKNAFQNFLHDDPTVSVDQIRYQSLGMAALGYLHGLSKHAGLPSALLHEVARVLQAIVRTDKHFAIF